MVGGDNGDPWRSPRVGANTAGIGWGVGSMLPRDGIAEMGQYTHTPILR